MSLKKNKLIRLGASIKITCLCLLWLFILTFWGTVSQVEDGLFFAQQKYFYSWFFYGFGFLPLPGARLTLWVMFINLVCAGILRFTFQKRHIGILIIHLGLITYFISAFVVFHVSHESHVTLREGQTLNVSSAYHQWELVFWQEGDAPGKKITALDEQLLKANETIKDQRLPFTLQVEQYFKNAAAYQSAQEDPPQDGGPVNASGIKTLETKPLNAEPEKNLPGGIFRVFQKDQSYPVLLYGGEMIPTPVTFGNETYFLQLRRKNFELPFAIKLKDFRKEVHPGTEMASSYESLVEVIHEGLTREVLIYMNEPLRFKDYTLYQASYAVDQMGRELSTLAVVKNAGRLLPYISSFIVFFGLVWHFLYMAFKRGNK
ncbi:MAG: cytochrome c biogenesis protein ResB [Candidatus Omnitrophica bacterium]|nr:cytochrome c biogenesis protein ResB [Candidatus Omnitrophota bacterium]